MIVTTDKLLLDGRTLTRCMVVLSPRLVDQVLVAVSMARSGVGPPYKVELDGMLFGLDVSPQGEPTLLEELPEAGLPVPVRAEMRPSLYFLEEFYALLSGLAARRPMKILGEEESGFEVDGDVLVPVLAQLEGTHTACQDGFNQEVLRRLSGRLRDGLLTRLEEASPAFFAELLAEVVELVAQKRSEYAADGLLAGWFQVYGEVFQGLDGWLRERPESERGVLLARLLGYGCAGAFTDPVLLVEGFLRHLGEPALLDRLGKRCLKRSQQKVQKALKAATQDEFEENLYRASLDLYASRQISRALERKSATQRAERRWLQVALALIHCLQNRSGERLEVHQARLQVLGKKRREELADDLIEQRLLYPRSMRESLLQA